MIALCYLENIASRHAELVSKYCSQGFSNLHTPTCNLGTSRPDPEQEPQTGALNRCISGQAHWRRLSGQALQDDKVSGSDHIASICFLRIVSSSCYMLLTYHPRDPRLRRSLLVIVFLQEFNCIFFVQWFADQMSLYSIATPFLQILFLPFVFYPFSYSTMT